MLVTPSNREFKGLTTRVFDPETGKALKSDEVVDLEQLAYDKKLHYLQVLAAGDLVEAQPKTINKKDKE